MIYFCKAIYNYNTFVSHYLLLCALLLRYSDIMLFNYYFQLRFYEVTITFYRISALIQAMISSIRISI